MYSLSDTFTTWKVQKNYYWPKNSFVVNYSVSSSDEDHVPHVLEGAPGGGGKPIKARKQERPFPTWLKPWGETCPWQSKHLSESQIGNETWKQNKARCWFGLHPVRVAKPYLSWLLFLWSCLYLLSLVFKCQGSRTVPVTSQTSHFPEYSFLSLTNTPCSAHRNWAKQNKSISFKIHIWKQQNLFICKISSVFTYSFRSFLY